MNNEKNNIQGLQVNPLQGSPVPPLAGTVLVAGYDSRDGSLRVLNLASLVEALQQAEALHTEDRVDERDKASLTILAGTAVDSVKTATLEVPTGEVWYLNRLNLVTPAGVVANVMVSKFPKTEGIEKAYLAADQAAASDTDYDLAAAGQLGADLRLVGGDKLTIRAKVTAAPVADVAVALTPFGRKARKLV